MSDYIPMRNKSISSFDILPTEILFLIFDYLTSNEIIYSFIECSQRLQHLLLTQKYCFKLPTKNLKFWNKNLPIIGPQIQTLEINIDHLTISLDFFSDLTAIIISSPYSLLNGQLKSILNHPCFQQLHTFRIKDVILSKQSYDENDLNDEQILFKHVFNDENQLQLFEYVPLERLYYRNLGELKSNTNIRSLTLDVTDFEDIFTLIQQTPNLIYLNIESKMCYGESTEYPMKNTSESKLEKLYLKFRNTIGIGIGQVPTDFDQLFRFIQLFSSSLITLSLDFADLYLLESDNVLLNGIELEKKLLKPMKKLQNFHFYVVMYECNDVKQILSTFETFPWPIGVHQNTYLYSLPFSFHELKFFRGFQYVLSNDAGILKDGYRLWCKVRSLELMRSDRIDFKTLFPLIKLNMPKLSSITIGKTFFNCFGYDNAGDADDKYNEIDLIHVQLNSVTTVRLERISTREIKRIKQILIHNFPNLQCLILGMTKLSLKENNLSSFLGQKLQRIEFDDYSSQVNDFSHLSNLKYLKLTYDFIFDQVSDKRSQVITNLLTQLPKLETLSIYAIPSSGCFGYGPEDIFGPILNRLDRDQIQTKYEIKSSGNYMWFIRNSLSCSL